MQLSFHKASAAKGNIGKENIIILDRAGNVLVEGPLNRATQKALRRLVFYNRDILRKYNPLEEKGVSAELEQGLKLDDITGHANQATVSLMNGAVRLGCAEVYKFATEGEATAVQSTRMDESSRILKKIYGNEETEKKDIRKIRKLLAGPRPMYGLTNIQTGAWKEDTSNTTKKMALSMAVGAVSAWATVEALVYAVSRILSESEIARLAQKLGGMLPPFSRAKFALAFGMAVGAAFYGLAKLASGIYGYAREKLVENALLTLTRNDFTYASLADVLKP